MGGFAFKWPLVGLLSSKSLIDSLVVVQRNGVKGVLLANNLLHMRKPQAVTLM